jgi:predicted nuclease with TOPRIM domain
MTKTQLLGAMADLYCCDLDTVLEAAREVHAERNRLRKDRDNLEASVVKAQRTIKANDAELAKLRAKVGRLEHNAEQDARFFELMGREATQMKAGARFQVRTNGVAVDLKTGGFQRFSAERLRTLREQLKAGRINVQGQRTVSGKDLLRGLAWLAPWLLLKRKKAQQ